MFSVRIREEVIGLDTIFHLVTGDADFGFLLLMQLVIFAFGVVLWGREKDVDVVESRIKQFRHIDHVPGLKPIDRFNKLVQVCKVVTGTLVLRRAVSEKEHR